MLEFLDNAVDKEDNYENLLHQDGYHQQWP